MNETRQIAHVDRKYLEYDFIEQRILPLQSPYTGNQPLQANQRCFFGPNNKLIGKRIVGIDIMANTAAFVHPFGGTVIAAAGLLNLMLTICNKDGDQALQNYPMADLHRFQTNGKIRIFDIVHNIEESFVITNTTFIAARQVVLFNFYTVNW